MCHATLTTITRRDASSAGPTAPIGVEVGDDDAAPVPVTPTEYAPTFVSRTVPTRSIA
jgi:hypothetical protein